MAAEEVDLATWPRTPLFRFFRTFQRPHYAITSRVDVTALIARKGPGFSPFRACLYAIGAGVAAEPALRMRFKGEGVVVHDSFAVSMAVATETGSFDYAYVPWQSDPLAFDAASAAIIAATARQTGLNRPEPGEDAVIYGSCLPWMDYTSLNNALPGPEDCVPRVSWGRFTPHAAGWDMAMTLEVNHALVDGAHVGAFFGAVQQALS